MTRHITYLASICHSQLKTCRGRQAIDWPRSAFFSFPDAQWPPGVLPPETGPVKRPGGHLVRVPGLGTKRLLSPGGDYPIEVLEIPSIVDPDALSAQDVPRSNPPIVLGRHEQGASGQPPSTFFRCVGKCADNLSHLDLGSSQSSQGGQAGGAHAKLTPGCPFGCAFAVFVFDRALRRLPEDEALQPYGGATHLC